MLYLAASFVHLGERLRSSAIRRHPNKPLFHSLQTIVSPAPQLAQNTFGGGGNDLRLPPASGTSEHATATKPIH